MAIIQKSDFVGEFDIAKPLQTEQKLEDFIDQREKHHLIKLFGYALYQNFIADLTANTPQTPQNTPFTTIFSDFEIDDHHCYGLKYALKLLIYFDWEAQQWLKKTASGTVKVDSENSTVLAAAKTDIINKYNEAVDQYHLVQYYIINNLTLFEVDGVEFHGKHLEYMPLG